MIAESSSKTFERQQSLTLPIFEQAINTKAKAKLYFAGPNPAPFKIDLSFQIEVTGSHFYKVYLYIYNLPLFATQ